MAEAVVSLIVDRIGDLLIQQASFLVGVKDQVENLRNELMWIQSFLEDADSRQDEGSVVQTWVSEIRHVAHDIEDIIDTYILKVVDEDENPTIQRRGILVSLKKYACICQKGANLYTIGKEVEEVKTRIRRIGEAMQKYGIHRKDGGAQGGDMRRPSPQERFLQLRRSSPHDDGTLKDTIELDNKVEELVAKLENKEDHINDLLMKEQGKNNVEMILSLSYNDLPLHLKPCYLYIGLFPKDMEINARQLIQLWVAEGFIRCERDYQTMEDVAEEYLNELIDRNMLQVVLKDEMGQVSSCRIHDLVRDICISEGQKNHFIDYSPHATSSSSSSTMVTTYTSRRYAIHSGIGRYDCVNLSFNSHLHTLLLFSLRRTNLQQRQVQFISQMKLLRVLDLSHLNLQGMRLPDAFGNLIHLRCLRLNNAKLPSSIERLRSLLILALCANSRDGGCCRWHHIPIGALSKLKQLRHLNFNGDYWNGIYTEASGLQIHNLTNLQSLDPVSAIVWEEIETTNLINLQHLVITGMWASRKEKVLSSIAKLDRIQSLTLQIAPFRYISGPVEFDAFSTLQPLSHCHLLQDLSLIGDIERLPQDPYRDFPPRLTRLKLEDSKLGLEAMTILEKLPHLKSLTLGESSIVGKKIVFATQGFPQLRFLTSEHLEAEKWEIKEGALPKLSHLSIFGCYNLENIPEGLRFVASIQVLKLRSMSREFLAKYDRREDAHEIVHIPSIQIDRQLW